MESPFKPDVLKGKVALLTGGGSVIGFEKSRQLGLRGASVAVMGRRKHVLDSAVAALHLHGIPLTRKFPSFLAHTLQTLSFLFRCLMIESLVWCGPCCCKAIGVEGEVRKRDDVVRALESTVKSFGRLDILVNAAAGNFLVPAEDLSPNGYRC
ncbi:peroxisomal 2,4-dienoyl-CoA reductase-like [Eucalyptus grandis]|uniref:peroxisomal 2,4-dienoyl-CoA reductase-like n=1 Tax=Eucalyptus grandis TaxID=71139 RepID=UPI00192EEF15|nr:peroxisomal 2,4-dienoyl-CoA reductase-like [Eucalyptus grandis]